ncbi:MAG: AAA family ATPase [Chthoniobacterales bacterium]|nr:AAA family ATPase [Chthoniobacterales bacterium]
MDTAPDRAENTTAAETEEKKKKAVPGWNGAFGGSVVDQLAIWDGDTGTVTLPELGEVLPGLPLIYPGAINPIAGPTGIGKSNILLEIARSEAAAGRRFLWVDPEDVCQRMLRRAKSFGYPRSFAEMLVYSQKPDAEDLKFVVQQAAVQEDKPTIIIDGVASVLRKLGLKINDNDDAYSLIQGLLQPATAAGCAVIIADHFGRDVDARHAKGATSKLDLTDGSAFAIRAMRGKDGKYSATIEDKDGRIHPGKAGGIEIEVVKDRHSGLGAAEGERIARLWFDPVGVGQTRLTWTDLRPEGKDARQSAEDGGEKPTVLMGRIVDHLQKYPGEVKRELRKLGSSDGVDWAINKLHEAGEIRVIKEGNSHRHYLTEKAEQPAATFEPGDYRPEAASKKPGRDKV